MEYIISTKSSQKHQIAETLHSVRNDFLLILINSSALLPDFINKMLLSSDYVIVPETQKFPQKIIENVFSPNIEYFNISLLLDPHQPLLSTQPFVWILRNTLKKIF